MASVLDTALWISTSWMSLCCVVALLITCHSIFHLCVRDSSEWISKLYRNITISIMTVLTISSVSILMRIVVSFYLLRNVEISVWHLWWKSLSGVADISYFTGNILFYIMILLRIHIPFRLGKSLYVFSALIFVSAAISVVYCVCLFLFNDPKYNDYWRAIYLTLSAVDFILNTYLLLLFTYKMKQTVRDMHGASSGAGQAAKAKLISNVMTKHCLLFSIAIMANQCFCMAQVQASYAIDNADLSLDTSWIRVMFVPSGAMSLEIVANVAVLWLILQVNYERYIRMCGCCHVCVAKCCLKNDGDRRAIVENPYVPLQDL